MADFQNPKNTNPLLSLFGYVRDGLDSIARMFDGTTDSNVPTGAKKIDGSTKVVSQWNGSSWVAIGTVGDVTSIDADSVTVSNLETDNFKSGVIVTTIGATGADDKIPTEQAVREAIAATASSNYTSFTVTLGGFDGTTNILNGYYVSRGGFTFVVVEFRITGVGTSGANTNYITLPVTALVPTDGEIHGTTGHLDTVVTIPDGQPNNMYIQLQGSTGYATSISYNDLLNKVITCSIMYPTA